MKFEVGEEVIVISLLAVTGTVIDVASGGAKPYLVSTSTGDLDWFAEKDLEAY